MEKNELTQIGAVQISDRQKFIDALMASGFFLILCWGAFVMDEYLGMHLREHGLRPRSAEGLIGIVSIHFLHSGLDHIWQNTLAFVVLNTLLFYFYRPVAWRIFLWLLVAPGVLLWIWARPDNHIGASMIIYGLAAFVFLSGLLRWDAQLMRVSLLVVFFYGGLVWYMFPVEERISWEGHLSGAVAGVVLAVLFRNKEPYRKKFAWENEPEEPDDNADSGNLTNVSENGVEIKYHYKNQN